MSSEIRPFRAGLVAGACALALLSALRAQEDPVPPSHLPFPPPPAAHPGMVLVDDMWLPEWAVTGEGAYLGTRWTGGNVRVAFDPSMSTGRKDFVRKAMIELESVAAIDFFEVSPGYSGDYILVGPNPGYPNVGSSEVGMVGGEQDLVLGANFFVPEAKYSIAHEFMHALGYKHEQGRPDRDIYVQILWANISQVECNGGSCDQNFELYGGATMFGPYDFESIMHYPDTAFNIGSSRTIQTRPAFSQFQGVMGNRWHFSTGDANALQAVYGQPRTPQTGYCTPNAVEALSNWSSLEVTVGGNWFFEGSLDGEGVLGTRVRFNGTIVPTTWVDQHTVTAEIPGALLGTPGTYPVDVINHSEAGGISSASVNFIVLPPPCIDQFDRVGHAVAGLGDVDGDGKDDYAVGTPGYANSRGIVRVISGGTGAEIWDELGPASAGTRYGNALASLGDITGDGRPDLLIGSPGYNGSAGRFEIRSGSTGALLSAVNHGTALSQFGWSVAGLGDVDGDGDTDFIVGAPGYSSYVGRAEIWSTNGGLIRAHNGGAASDVFGTAVGGGLDVTGDGRPDYIVGAPDRENAGGFDVGRAYIYSGATGALAATKDGDASYDRFGHSVALIPNTGLSGLPGNVLVGAPQIPNLFGGGGNGAGYARLFRGYSLLNGWATLATFTGGQAGDRFGFCVGGAGDVDDDGQQDLLIGIPQGSTLSQSVGPGTFEVLAGGTYEVLYHHVPAATDEQLGWSVSLVGDADADARLDFVVGAPGSDTGCIDSGGYYLVKPPVAPEHRKVLITEVTTGNPDGVEITNCGAAAAYLTGWKIRWKDGANLVESPALNATLQPGEVLVVREAGTVYAEQPANVQTLVTLPSVGTSSGDVAVALVNSLGKTVDEVRLQSSLEIYTEGSLGGKWRGIVAHAASGPGEVNAQRIWGLDSNGGTDWSTGGPRSLGLRNADGPVRGTDPIPLRTVRINEIDDNPDYVELFRPGTFLFSPAVDLAGWYLLASSGQGLAHTKLRPFPGRTTLAAGRYLVIGDASTAPAEKPATVPYVDLAALGAGNIPWITEEYDCALYDSFGRLVDLVRTTGHDDTVVHNEPRAPAHGLDFTGAATRTPATIGVIGRNATSTDTNNGDDFTGMAVRSMGAPNIISGGFSPSGDRQLDAYLDDTPLGGGITIILNAGPENAGKKWTFTFSYGHLQGTGPILGLGLEAVDIWLAASVTPPFFGLLDSRGSARLDFPGGSLPPGIDTDDLFLLQENNGNPLAAATSISFICEYDT